jgi:hypothetical protein
MSLFDKLTTLGLKKLYASSTYMLYEPPTALVFELEEGEDINLEEHVCETLEKALEENFKSKLSDYKAWFPHFVYDREKFDKNSEGHALKKLTLHLFKVAPESTHEEAKRDNPTSEPKMRPVMISLLYVTFSSVAFDIGDSK